jgi:hypothetical protein
MTEFKITPAQEAVLHELWRKGQTDNYEHLAHMRGDVLLMSADGDETDVRFPEGYTRNIRRGDVILHNHPTVLNSFSNADLAAGAYRGTDSYIITEDQSMYFSRPLTDVDAFIDSWELTNELLHDVTFEAFRATNVDYCDACSTRLATNDAHFLNLFLAKIGVIEYSYRLSETTQKIVDAVKGYAASKAQ